jgi:hypothetical protein
MSSSRLQELIAQAVTGRAETWFNLVDVLPAEATEVLGVRVTGAEVQGRQKSDGVQVDLLIKYDAWCANENGTWVTQGAATLESPVSLKRLAKPMGETEVAARLVGVPVVKNYRIANGQVTVDLKANVLVEQVGTTRLWVRAIDMDDDLLEDVESEDDDDLDDDL